MKLSMKTFLTIPVLAISLAAFAQSPLDEAYEKNTTAEKQPIPYEHIREADVFWEKRIWRVVDVREKMNLPFKYPQMPLIQILHEAAKTGELTVYDAGVENADQFKKVMSVDEVRKIGESEDTILTVNPETLEEETKVQKTSLTWDKIIKYRIKEVWLFDEETSTMIVRILGIAPVMDYQDASGSSLGDKVMYWIYYPDARELLAGKEVFNSKNDAVRMSWEDIFEARMFQSYIYKESNVYDRNIQEYATGVDALLESDRIKDEMFNFEHDLWNY